MSQDVKLYTPDVRVTLYKVVDRNLAAAQSPGSATLFGPASSNTVDSAVASSTQSSSDSWNLFGQPAVGSHKAFTVNQAIDLTPFLGEFGSMSVTKSVRDPAGSFSIVLADKPYLKNGVFESIYACVEPMDFIEVRMRHSNPVGAANPSQPPILMRGFVSEVEREQITGEDGKPHRTVSISGNDYGKLMQMLQIMYTQGYVIGENILSAFKLFERFNVGFVTAMKAADFVQQTVSAVVDPFLQSLMPANSPNPATIKFDISVANGVVDIGGVQNQQGTIHNLLTYFGDVGLFNELFLEDREDGVYCVYRPNPAKDMLGHPIQDDAPNLMPIDVSGEDVISLKVARSDAGTANFFWIRAPKFELVSDIFRTQFAAVSLQQAEEASVNLTRYPNCAERFYGMRGSFAETQQGGNDVTTFNSGQPKTVQNVRDASMANWITNRREILAAQNRDNALLEAGTARIRANEQIRAGCYVRIVQGAFSSVFYVPKVVVDYVPFVGLFQTLTLERGTGYVQRMNAGSGAASPYLAELAVPAGA
ncbi:hypothetical protein [Paraburkholderia diazotrophica]|uniref:Uncharacterized protein n=1 Tax=Paraburkholderia diazotrophica TaxID=667676 RepID=A0A1H6TQH6_9BURK|nr:hypothetical protein [Paraburkholderia diazotrophica]SEI80454.1 hypothetical protein SAMN05192539_1004164 [Paraburkholderia diazotrophica]